MVVSGKVKPPQCQHQGHSPVRAGSRVHGGSQMGWALNAAKVLVGLQQGPCRGLH